MVQLSTIKKSDQENVIHVMWILMGECERQADNDNDPVLKVQVEGAYRLWNKVTGDDARPRWVKREAVAEAQVPTAAEEQAKRWHYTSNRQPSTIGTYFVECGVSGDRFLAGWDGFVWLNHDGEKIIFGTRNHPGDRWLSNTHD